MVCPICITTAIMSQAPAITAALGATSVVKVASDMARADAKKPAQDAAAPMAKSKAGHQQRRFPPPAARTAAVKACCRKPTPGALSASRRP